jgi:hypothetical protein
VTVKGSASDRIVRDFGSAIYASGSARRIQARQVFESLKAAFAHRAHHPR